VTRSQIRAFVENSTPERVREVVNRLEALRRHEPIAEGERAFLHDLRDHEPFFRSLADRKLRD
jgi:hypothetical protein